MRWWIWYFSKHMRTLCCTWYSSILKQHLGDHAGLKQQDHFLISELRLKKKKIIYPFVTSTNLCAYFFPATRWKNLHGKTYLYFESKMEWCLDFNISWMGIKCHIFICSCFIKVLNTSLKTHYSLSSEPQASVTSV